MSNQVLEYCGYNGGSSQVREEVDKILHPVIKELTLNAYALSLVEKKESEDEPTLTARDLYREALTTATGYDGFSGYTVHCGKEDPNDYETLQKKVEFALDFNA